MTILTYAQAAERLRVPERWLRRNISRLPHSKKGRVVTFTEDDLSAIESMHHVEPPPSAVVAGSDLSALRPLPARRSVVRTGSS